MRALSLPILLLGSGCIVERELGSLSEAEAAMVYTTMKSRLQEVHELVLNSDRPPNMYEYGCSSGTIQLQISLDSDMQPQQLRHAFAGCDLDGLTFSGKVHYLDLDECEGETGVAVTIGAQIELAGAMDGFCYMELRDRCGALTGHLCGFRASTAIAPD
jgi:hypothetical protein